MLRPVRLFVVLMCVLIGTVAFFPAAFTTQAAPPVQETQGEACPALVSSALDMVRGACGAQGTDTVCYGFNTVQTTTLVSESFDAPGQILDLSDVQTIMTMPANVDAGEWGIAVLKLSAGLPEGATPVTAVLFGDASLTSAGGSGAVEAGVTLIATTPDGDPVLLRQGANHNTRMATQLLFGQEGIADGRSEDANWVRVRAEGGIGWAFVPLIELSGDIMTLPVLDPNDLTVAGQYSAPMQEATLVTGAPNEACAEASSGLLLQGANEDQTATPATLLINDVTFTIGKGTVLITSSAGEMRVMAIDGAVTVTALGTPAELTAGQMTRIALNAENKPADTPRGTGGWNIGSLNGAPLNTLPNAVACTVGVTAEDGTIRAHSGPGANEYTPLFYLQPDVVYSVIGWANDANNVKWWKLANAQGNENWVNTTEVRSVGACETVEETDALAAFGGDAGYDGPPGGGGFAPSSATIWNAATPGDEMSGTCNTGPLNYCTHMVSIQPRGSGLVWRGQELKPYYMARVEENVYGFVGRNGLDDATVRITVVFTSPTTFTMRQVYVLDADPLCTHSYTFTGTLR
jgi:hypothetical protein